MNTMIKISVKGDLNKSKNFLKRNKKISYKSLEKYAQEGVVALSNATPKDTGFTAASWYYELRATNTGISIVWKNSNIVDGVPIAIILEYGHATRNGGYVQGAAYIESALRPVFERIADDVWKEVIYG